MIDRSWIPPRTETKDDSTVLREIDRVIAAGPYSSTWESLQRYRPPRWFGESKFGIFIHWGIYSVPAFADEWYSRNMYRQGRPEFDHHRATYGDQATFGYKDFIPDFRMLEFDPVGWAALFRRAGAQYVVPVAEHHDGFANGCMRIEYCADLAEFDTKATQFHLLIDAPQVLQVAIG